MMMDEDGFGFVDEVKPPPKATTAKGKQPTKEQSEIPPLKPVVLEDFMATKFPPRELILSPWLPEKGLAMLYANRGVGKTWVGLNIAWAIATGGSFLKWQATKPRKVLIVDGEMPANVLQERLAGVIAAHGKAPPIRDAVRIIANDLEEFGIPDLATPDGQAILDKALGDADVIILDNLSTLLRSGRENESESWAVFQGWLLAKRRQGRAILMIHHAGKGGQQRGTSKREDVLDTVVNLKRPSDYEATEGARFEVHYEKSRGFSGDGAESFEAALVDGAWIVKSLSDEKEVQVLRLKAEGLTQREIAQEVGLSLSKVNRIIKKAEEGPGYGLKS